MNTEPEDRAEGAEHAEGAAGASHGGTKATEQIYRKRLGLIAEALTRCGESAQDMEEGRASVENIYINLGTDPVCTAETLMYDAADAIRELLAAYDAQVARAEDAELIAWGISVDDKSPARLRQTTHGGLQWMLVTRPGTDPIPKLGYGQLPILTDEARIVLTAARAAVRAALRGEGEVGK